ncbi:MAG: 2-phospho-L-lactate transferase [Betaproteobacteria bacterium]|nr:2-phospho-L-lactate transferase [Betaproteobacteria bacterium]MDH3437987.1 2-phospho-L-lactate transferase [Betaproteobacteria bacterium]
MIVALAGGVGGARLAAGLAAVVPPQRLAVVVNTGDDFEHLGLSICPDLDTVLYTLAGVNNPVLGWGRADETWHFMQTLEALGGTTWFRLGDRDLALHILRTQALCAGIALSEVTRQIAARLGVRAAVMPMSDTPVRTRVRTTAGELDFQDYFVRRQCHPRVRGLRFAGCRKARPPRALRTLMGSGRVRAVVVCPSNPYLSVAPILSVPAIRGWLERRDFPVVAVSPIVSGAAIKGPAAKIMGELGCEVSALGVVRHYGKRVDGWVIDRRDAKLKAAIESQGKAVLVTDTIMTGPRKSAALARRVVAFAQLLAEEH